MPYKNSVKTVAKTSIKPSPEDTPTVKFPPGSIKPVTPEKVKQTVRNVYRGTHDRRIDGKYPAFHLPYKTAEDGLMASVGNQIKKQWKSFADATSPNKLDPSLTPYLPTNPSPPPPPPRPLATTPTPPPAAGTPPTRPAQYRIPGQPVKELSLDDVYAAHGNSPNRNDLQVAIKAREAAGWAMSPDGRTMTKYEGPVVTTNPLVNNMLNTVDQYQVKSWGEWARDTAGQAKANWDAHQDDGFLERSKAAIDAVQGRLNPTAKVHGDIRNMVTPAIEGENKLSLIFQGSKHVKDMQAAAKVLQTHLQTLNPDSREAKNVKQQIEMLTQAANTANQELEKKTAPWRTGIYGGGMLFLVGLFLSAIMGGRGGK